MEEAPGGDLDVHHTAGSLPIRAALLAARFSGHVCLRYLVRLARRDAGAKAKEIHFLKDQFYQLKM